MIVTLLLFILILGIIVFVHELGHFLWAKSFGVYIYEFSIGMGPVIFSKKGKDGINYNIRAFPIGGFVSMAGEVYEDDKTIPKERFLCNKPVWQRIIVMAAGVINNFILAILLLFFNIFLGYVRPITPRVENVKKDYPMEKAGIEKGNIIISINNHKTNTWDEAQVILNYKNNNDYYEFKIKDNNGTIKDYKITPLMEKQEDGSEVPKFGIEISNPNPKGLFGKIKYAFSRFGSIVASMWLTIAGLITGKISLDALSGPVGIYSVVGESAKIGFSYVVFLIAYLSINVGVINILPFPAFDGGRIFFLIIEKIKGSPVNSKFENTCHTIGFILLMILIIFISIKDVIKLF